MAEATNPAGVDVDRLETDFEADPGNFVPLARAYIERKLAEQAVLVCKRGLKKNPGAKDGLLALAMAYYHAYDDRNAEKVLQEVLRATPDSATAHRTLGEILLERHQEQLAVQELMRAIEIEPRDTHARSLLVALNEKVPAMQTANGLPEGYWIPRLTVIPKEVRRPLWIAFAQVLVLAALVAGGLVYYSHYVGVQVQIREHVKKATAIVPRDNFPDLLAAEKELNAALALDEGEERVLVRQAFVQALLWQDHAQADRKEKLKAALAVMESSDIPNPERFSLKGLMLIDEGKLPEAEKFLDEVINRAIDKKDIYLNAMIFGVRGIARTRQGRTEDAREDFSRAARFSGDSPHYLSAFADVYLREGNLPRAAKYYQDALRQNPAHLASSLRLTYTLIQLGKGLEQAKKALDEYGDAKRHPDTEFSPPMKGMLHVDKAEFALVTGNLQDANASLSEALKAYEPSAEAHDLAGRLATIANDPQKAQASFARALQLDPMLPKVYFDRSESLFLLGQKAEAVDKLRDFEKALKPTVAYHVKAGNLYLRMDDLEKALGDFQKAVGIDELSPDARFHVALTYQKMGEKFGTAKEKLEEKRVLYNKAREEYENTLILPGGERADVYHMMGLIYLDFEDFDNAMDKLAKAAMMLQQAGESPQRIAAVYLDVSKVFKAMGGSEGEKQEKIYLAKAEALRSGKSLDQVEKEWAEQAEKDKKKPPRRRRGR